MAASREGAPDAARSVFCPASMDDLRKAGDVSIDALPPAHIMSRNYLRFDTMVLLTRIGESSLYAIIANLLFDGQARPFLLATDCDASVVTTLLVRRYVIGVVCNVV